MSGLNLVAEIGATQAVFQYCSEGRLHGPVVELPTPLYKRANDLLGDALAALGGDAPQRALLAITGADGIVDSASGSNAGLSFTAGDCAAVLGCPARVVDGFYGLANDVLDEHPLLQIGGDRLQAKTRFILRSSRELDMAIRYPVLAERAESQQRWQVVISRGGHADLAPGNHLEMELWGALITQHDCVSWSTVLSEPGLQHLYQAMCAVWGMSPQVLSPHEIMAQGVDMSEPVCHQTLETFCGFLGAMAGNMAVTLGATGGVYVSGGLLAQMSEFLLTSPFRRRFDERGAMTDLVRNVPVLVLLEQGSGVAGLARSLAQTVPE